MLYSVTNESSKIRLEVYSDQPGVQFYSGNFLPDAANGEEAVIGKGGAKYTLHGAMCLETQNYPNAINLVRPKAIVSIYLYDLDFV
jgi:aldose 1-epimerase